MFSMSSTLQQMILQNNSAIMCNIRNCLDLLVCRMWQYSPEMQKSISTNVMILTFIMNLISLFNINSSLFWSVSAGYRANMVFFVWFHCLKFCLTRLPNQPLTCFFTLFAFMCVHALVSDLFITYLFSLMKG